MYACQSGGQWQQALHFFEGMRFSLKKLADPKLTTPWKIHGWNLPIPHLERKMIFQTSMIMFHVNLPGCNFHALDPKV